MSEIWNLIGEKFENSLGMINDLIFSPEWTKLCNIVGELKTSKFFSPERDFTDQNFTGELYWVDSAGVMRQGVLILPANLFVKLLYQKIN